MNTIPSWDALLAAPAPCDHMVQLYTDEQALVSTAARFIEHGIADGIDPFDRAEYKDTLPSIGHVHSHMMPVEDAERLEHAIDRAFVDVFGVHGDTRLLRELFVRQLPGGAAMPIAQGALFALRTVDAHLADAVLERAVTHYRSA